MKNLSALIISTVMLTACQTGTGTNYENNSNTYKGAGIGALAGGVIGALTNKNNRGKNAAIGAGIGALAGVGIGQYMDSQEAELRQATEGTNIDVVRSGDDLLLNMPSSVTFSSNSSTVQQSLKPTLNNVAEILRNYPETIIEITGHTDSDGSENYNLTLSDERASSVADYLFARGVSQRIITTGMGESQPIATNSTQEGKAQNRRVEIKISPMI